MTSKSATKLTRARRLCSGLAWFNLLYIALVILWGAYVRATGSGAGCGEHWPLCNGEMIPRAPELATVIEFSHRLTSGLSLVFMVAMLVFAFRGFKRGHPARQAAVLSVVFLVIEALIGAGLVLLSLVADNDSVMRAVAIALHLCNTFVLLGCLTYMVWTLSLRRSQRFMVQAPALRCGLMIAGMGLFILVGASGGIVALGDTLFPSPSLMAGLRQDVSEAAHFLIRLRVFHPILAVGTGLFLILVATYLRKTDPRPGVVRLSLLLTALLLTQIVLGFANMALLAPVWMQMVHLLMADVTWVVLVATTLHTLSEPAAKSVLEKPLKLAAQGG